jgi:hypothetical protein
LKRSIPQVPQPKRLNTSNWPPECRLPALEQASGALRPAFAAIACNTETSLRCAARYAAGGCLALPVHAAGVLLRLVFDLPGCVVRKRNVVHGRMILKIIFLYGQIRNASFGF